VFNDFKSALFKLVDEHNPTFSEQVGVSSILDTLDRAGCEFSRVPTLLTLAIVVAKNGSRV
jgi:hypothetical protein